MEYRKKLKARLIFSFVLLITGIGIIITSNLFADKSGFFSPFGLGLAVINLVRIRNYFIITRNKDKLKSQEIAETDERNLMIANKAKSIAFYIYVLMSCAAVIVLQLFNKTEIGTYISFSVCAMLLIYWVCYFIIRKKY